MSKKNVWLWVKFYVLNYKVSDRKKKSFWIYSIAFAQFKKKNNFKVFLKFKKLLKKKIAVQNNTEFFWIDQIKYFTSFSYSFTLFDLIYSSSCSLKIFFLFDFILVLHIIFPLFLKIHYFTAGLNFVRFNFILSCLWFKHKEMLRNVNMLHLKWDWNFLRETKAYN